jgi:hypothetical protein
VELIGKLDYAGFGFASGFIKEWEVGVRDGGVEEFKRLIDVSVVNRVAFDDVRSVLVISRKLGFEVIVTRVSEGATEVGVTERGDV